MTAPTCLVLAKAPIAGRAKTRLGREIGMEAAALVAAAAMLDTLSACTEAFGPEHCRLALDGDLALAVEGTAITRRLRGWTVFAQRGNGLAERIAHAHCEAGPGPVVQIGMDTPQVQPTHLVEVAMMLGQHDAVLGPAEDGGWWVLGLTDPTDATLLCGVQMSRPDTCRDTRKVLERAGLDVAATRVLRDVDTRADATAVAAVAPEGGFAMAWGRSVGVPW